MLRLQQGRRDKLDVVTVEPRHLENREFSTTAEVKGFSSEEVLTNY